MISGTFGRIGCIVLVTAAWPFLVRAEKEPAQASSSFRLTDCIDVNLGFKIKCSPKWEKEVKPQSLMLIIKGRPRHIVTATVTRFDESNVTLAELTPLKLQNTFQYADNFKVGPSRVDGRKALVVLAQPAYFPHVQFIDYFTVHNRRLFRINFSVNTKNLFDKYKDLFGEMIRSFEFLEEEAADASPAEKGEEEDVTESSVER